MQDLHGLTAALYALRANKKVLIIEAKCFGGQIINASKIENYPGIQSINGIEYATNLYNQVLKFNANFKFETVIRITKNKEVITKSNQYKAKAIIIATGTVKKKLGIENESLYIGKGLSYCAICDGKFFKDKDVAVIGSGKEALEDASYLADLANKVYIVSKSADFDEEKRLYNEINNKNNVEFFLNSNVEKIYGENKLESIDVIINGNTKRKIDIQGLFIAIGQEPKNEIFKPIVELDENGYIITKNEIYTSCQGIYVAGDARKKFLRQLTTAVGDGALAATMAIKEMK